MQYSDKELLHITLEIQEVLRNLSETVEYIIHDEKELAIPCLEKTRKSIDKFSENVFKNALVVVEDSLSS